jgi:hypothetical protein
MQARRRLIVLGALAAVMLIVPHPHADIRVLTHDSADPAPRRILAALDLGLVDVSLLVTWTARRLAR